MENTIIDNNDTEKSTNGLQMKEDLSQQSLGTSYRSLIEEQA